MENYEKLYREALSRAKVEQETFFNLGNISAKTAIEKIFPELRESEDERIRKEIVDYLRKFIPHHDCDLVAKSRVWIAWLEKQGEQKSVDNVEPKFNVGDWVMLDRPVLITKVEDMPYNTHQYWTSDGKWFGDATKAKLWTIQDAKDGDVLAEHETIVLFKKIEGQNIRCYCTYHYLGFNPTFYVGTLQNKNSYYPATKEQHNLLLQKMKETGYEWDAEKKELKMIENTSNMTEALRTEYGKGRADAIAEMKTIEWSEEDEEILNNIITAFKRIGENCEHYFSPDTAKVFEKTLKSLKDRVQSQSKQEWSEEDESMLTRCIGILGKCYMKELPNKVEEELIWLKSINSKIQPKQEWSKEDSERLDRIYKFIWANRKGDTDEIYQQEQDADWLMTLKPQPKQEWSEEDKEMLYNCLGLIQEIDCTQEEQNWLKSLIKPQNRWKPSEQNIKDLEWCADLVKDKMGVGFHRLQVFIDDLKKL